MFVYLPVWMSIACIERVTGETVPLDPRFYAAVEEIRGAETQGGGASVPFSSSKEEKIQIRGMVLSESDMSVDIDVRVPDPKSPGGMAGKGKILLERPGEFTLSVPKNLGSLELQAFQDIDSDGPNATDPFAQVTIRVEAEDIDTVEMTLVAGARGAAPVHQEVPPQGDDQPIGKGIPENPDPFGGIGGNRIRVTGTLQCDNPQNIDLDIFTPDQNSPGGRKMLGKMKLQQGEFTILVPENYGSLILEAFVDLDGNGPGIGDFMGVFDGNPLQISSTDIDGVDIVLLSSVDGKMPLKPVTLPQ